MVSCLALFVIVMGAESGHHLLNQIGGIWSIILTHGYLDSNFLGTVIKTDKIRHRLVNSSGITDKLSSCNQAITRCLQILIGLNNHLLKN